MNAVVDIGYQAGTEDSLPHLVRIHFNRAKDDTVRSDLIARWIEFWCQQYCEARWRVTEFTRSHVDVYFEDQTDLVLFKLSPEFDLQ